MPDTLHVQEVWIDATDSERRCITGESEVYDTGRAYSELGNLYRELVREHGRCIGRVYINDGVPIGYVFLKRRAVEDYRGNEPRTWLCETWVTVHTAPDTVTRTPHYFDPKATGRIDNHGK